MLDYTVFEAIRSSVAEARNTLENASPKRGAIFVEVKNITRQTSLLPNFDGFEFSELLSFGAITEEDYCNFLRTHVHTSHQHILDRKPPIKVGWENSPILVAQCELSFDTEPYIYSVIVGVVGGTREENQAALDVAIKGIESCQPK